MSLKSILIGQPLETVKEKHERLSKTMGLAVFSSDALSSTAYGTEEILLALSLGGAAFYSYSLPIAFSIIILVAIVTTSYYQTIHAYPSGGGAYIVAKENLGTYPGLIAGAALLIDYVLTVTVSISAGVAAITSAFPHLRTHVISLCLIAILFIVLMNLRGVKESGQVFSIPVYIFIGSLVVLIVKGFIITPEPVIPLPLPKPAENNVTGFFAVFIILKAFASGCATLTGIEAISNGIRAFRPPESKNAGVTLIWMAVMLGSLTLGIAFLVNLYDIIPIPHETVLSQLARRVFQNGAFYYVIQFSTAIILILAANTSFADFPRLSSIIASDRFLPRQMSNRGDRLVFSNGIIILAVFSAILIILFNGDTHSLIPLYAVGVFTAFTLSQAGMVQHWLGTREKNWRRGVAINGTGAVTTGIVLIVIAFEKFTQGAWIVLVMIPSVVFIQLKIQTHYRSVAEQLWLEEVPNFKNYAHHSVIIPISGIHKAVVNAIRYGKVLSNDVVAVYVSINPQDTKNLKAMWNEKQLGVPLVILESQYRSITIPFMNYIAKIRNTYKDGIITVVIPQFVPSKWWHHLLHNQTALFMKGMLLFKEGVVYTSVPLHLKK